MVASVLAGLFMTWGAIHGQDARKGDKTLSFVRDDETKQKQYPTSTYTVPAPTMIPTKPVATPVSSRASTPPPMAQPPKEIVPSIQRASYQSYDEEASLELPGPSRQFSRRSEKEVFEEIRLQARRKPGTIRPIFPEDLPISKDKYVGRYWSPMIETVEPNYVGHGRLIFEQQNFERGGWDFGIAQPLISLGVFYGDIATLPYQYWTRPFQRYDSSAGKCLPGDPTPLLLYPPELSLAGGVAEAATVAGTLLIFPP